MNRQSETEEAADPLADARAWLASMETTLRRVAQQASSHKSQVELDAETQATVPPTPLARADGMIE
jgi:hypothetical protein